MKNIFLVVCLLGSSISIAQRSLDSLWTVWNNNTRVDSVRMQALYEICRDYYAYSRPDSSLLLCDRLYKMAEARRMKSFAAKTLNVKLVAFVTKGENDSALACGRRVLELYRSIGHYQGVTMMADNIAVIYMNQGSYYQSLNLLFKSLRLKEHLHDSLLLSSSFINISKIYNYLGILDSAVCYQERALTIVERRGPRPALLTVVSNLGNFYQRKKQMEKSLMFYERARKLAEEFGAGLRLAQVYNNLTCYYRDNNDLKKALAYQNKSVEICQGLNNQVALAESMHLLSTVYYYMEQLEKARAIAEGAISLLGDEKMPELRRDMYADLGNIYYNQKNYNKALHLHLRFIVLRDSIRNDSLTIATLAAQSRAAAEKREMKLKAEADQRLAVIQSEAERRDQRKNIWIVVTVSLLLILGLSGYFTYRHWRQKNVIADQKNRLLSEKLLVTQMNPHFIFNSLNSIQNFIFKQDHYLAGIYLKQFSELMRMILEFSRREYISLKEEYRFLVSYLDLQKLRFGGKLDYRIVIDEQLDRESVLIPPMLGQPFVENAIEHGIFHLKEEGMLWIRIRPENNMLVYEIEDNGVGFAAAQLWKKTGHKSLATEITRDRLNALNQENPEKNGLEIIDKSSLPGRGSGVIVKFTIP
jgi:tetratricopeptide (TPR) repeat protein